MYQMIWYRHLGERWNPRQINSSKSKSKVQNNIEMGHYRWDPAYLEVELNMPRGRL